MVERLRLASPQRLLLVGEAGHRHGAALRAAIEQTWPAQAPSLVLVDQLTVNPTFSPALPGGEAAVQPGALPCVHPSVHPATNPGALPDTRVEAAVLTVDDHTPALDVVLGEACRRFPACLLVEYRSTAEQNSANKPLAGRIQAERFYALGFVRRCSVLDGQSRSSLYEFRLRDYKPAPAWLNARYWAHPERFDCDPDD